MNLDKKFVQGEEKGVKQPGECNYTIYRSNKL